MRYAILGPVELCDGERRLAVHGPRQVALLALLLINANRPLSNDRLIDALWGDLGPAGAVKRLQAAILRLRRLLDPVGGQSQSVLRTVTGGYLLAVAPGELDAEIFQARVEEGLRAVQAGEAVRARDMLRDALAMWRGPALHEVADEQFAQPEIRRLEELRLAAVEARVDSELRLGEHGRVVGELEALVAEHPGRERLAEQLMLALYRCGRQGDALDVYARTRAYLAGELGLEPGPAMKTLQRAILEQAPALAPDSSPTTTSGSRSVGEPIQLTLPRSLHAPADTPLVGREEELARLRERWADVNAGVRSAVVIGGEAGIGKTRLTSELAREVHEQGALVLYGRCDEGLRVPYQPFVEALRPYARAIGLDRIRRELAYLAPELRRLLPELAELGEPIRSDPESQRFALFEAVAALIETATREQRALLVVDDLHWAARPTLLMLRHLIRSERPLGALLLGTYRETELDPSQPLAQLLADLQRDASTKRLSIGGLDEPAIAALLEAAVGHALDERASQLVHVLVAQTAGNPFFIRELLAHLTESDERVDTRVTAARLEAPKGLRQVIGHRVARLSAPTRRALRVAAVAGPLFSFVLLERVLGERSSVLDALDEAVAAGLLAEAGHGDYVFAHALVRQTIYGQLGSARRMRLHRQLGEALEASGDTEAHVDALAHHFAQAAPDGQHIKAADYALAAGHNATAHLGYEEATAYYERGLQALTPTGPLQDKRRCELLLALGEARWGAGKPQLARQAYEQAAELADVLHDPNALARAALGFGGPYRFELVAAVLGPITVLLERALAALGRSDSPLRAQLLGRLAADTEHRAPVLANEALEMARRVADKTTLADVLTSCLWATRGPDAPYESLAITRELKCVANELGDSRLEAQAHGWLLDFLLELGDIDGVECELETLQRLAETRKEHYVAWLLRTRQASHAYLRGRLEDAEALAYDIFAHHFEGPDATAMIFGAQICLVRGEQGRLDEVMEDVEGFVRQSTPRFAGWRCGLAYMHAQHGHAAQAGQEVEMLAHADFEDLPRDASWLWNVSTLSEVVAILGDAARAQLLYRMLLPYADRCAVHTPLLCRGSASRDLGLLATTTSRYDEAEQHFKQALKMNAEIRSPHLIAHTRHDYAHMLLMRGRPGDNDKAHELLEQALATAEQLGLKALADKARPLKLTAETGSPPAALPPA